ncbi:YpoC family protein [Pseudalkalibacillus sp. Hm43]|uniref:YpoC family protein n=1 Tax=Pseudalkalibacillus sp. Hm43 TaxID=3450742 RepID=UPI003F42AAFA
MSKQNVSIPETFKNPLFFPDGDFIYDDQCNLEQLAAVPFLIDLLYYQGKFEQEELKYEQLVGNLFYLWEKEKTEIADDFKRRDRTAARSKMIKGIGWYLSLLHWMDGRGVDDLTDIFQSISKATVQPVNLNERLSFILDAPDHYQSFIQLSALFDETEKKWHTIERKKQHTDKN